MSERVDRELVQQAREGDRTAIGELFSRYWRAARAAAFGVTGEFASAEDAASEAFRQALAGMNSLRDPDRFGSWLRTIVVRKARLALGRRELALDSVTDDLSDPTERPDKALERIELAALVQQATRELPDPLREAMALVYFEGYDPEAASRFLDIPPGTLRRRLHDGRARLRYTVERLLQGIKPIDQRRERQMRRFKTMLEAGETYQAFREALALRPPPAELIDTLFPPLAAGKQHVDLIRDTVLRTLCSERASDPTHPVGLTAMAIRKALPDFEEWPHDAAEAAERFFTSTSALRGRLRIVLPPGFADGRPGAFLRASRALICLGEDGRVRSIYEHLHDSPNEQIFRSAKDNMRLSNVLDLTWMTAGVLELRSVQELLERLTAAVLPGVKIRFSTYDEPRYRAALELHAGNIPARAAQGGVLAEWPGRPDGVDAAHIRIFIEPWATLRCGNIVEFDSLPET